MADARGEKLAKVIVNYSLELKAGHTFWLRTIPLAEELNPTIYEGAVKAAVGLGFAECSDQNKSGLNWDMLGDMAESEITVDGKPVIE